MQKMYKKFCAAQKSCVNENRNSIIRSRDGESTHISRIQQKTKRKGISIRSYGLRKGCWHEKNIEQNDSLKWKKSSIHFRDWRKSSGEMGKWTRLSLFFAKKVQLKTNFRPGEKSIPWVKMRGLGSILTLFPSLHQHLVAKENSEWLTYFRKKNFLWEKMHVIMTTFLLFYCETPDLVCLCAFKNMASPVHLFAQT